MESFVWTVAGGLAVAAIASIVGSAFLRPALFMRLYPNVMEACLLGLVFGFGVAVGGKIVDGATISMVSALAAFLTWLILLPIAREVPLDDPDQKGP